MGEFPPTAAQYRALGNPKVLRALVRAARSFRPASKVVTVTGTSSTPVTVVVHPDRMELGRAAAAEIAACLRELGGSQESIRMMFAAAPSQLETLAALAHEPRVPWSRVTAFHMDEYRALPVGSRQGFGHWLRSNFFDHVPLARVELLDPAAAAAAEARRYAGLLHEGPIDVVLLGIGDNGHLAFNDPGADLDDPEVVREVRLDRRSREQQVRDGLFDTLSDVPTHALTVTIPTLLSAARVFCIAPGPNKARAVHDALQAPISSSCPATALRTHASVSLHLDRDSASLTRPATRIH